MHHQLVGEVANEQIYMGLFGLNPRSSNLSDYDDPVPSYLTNLKNASLIPSISWGFTAGNRYQMGGVFAGLVIGGFDAARFVPNNFSFGFSEDDSRDLTVTIQRIRMWSKNGTSVLLSESINAFVDSTVPYLYLPLSVCRSFEDAFSLTWNETVQAYLVGDTLHSSLIAQNMTVVFTLGTSPTGRSIDRKLPYSAFDLTASYPLLASPGRYFPLMRASNETQYTLARAFLQES